MHVTTFRNHVRMGRKRGGKRRGPHPERQVNGFSFFDDSDVGEDDALQKPKLKEKARQAFQARRESTAGRAGKAKMECPHEAKPEQMYLRSGLI